MGRVKVPIKKIQNSTSLKTTFSKRRSGLIKKAYELSVLCEIEVALIMFSPTGILSHFSGHSRIEDVLMRYLQYTEQQKTPAEQKKDIKDGIHNVVIPNKEYLISVLENLKAQADIVTQASREDSTIKDFNDELVKTHARYEELKDIWLLYGDMQNLHELTHEELNERETRLMDVVTQVRRRKKLLITNSSKLAASVPLPSMLPQISTLLPTTQGLVQLQPHQERTSSLILQPTKASNENIILQPPFVTQPSYFSNRVVPIPYKSTQVNPRKPTLKNSHSTPTWTPSLPTIPKYSVFQQSLEDGDNQFSKSIVDVKTPYWPETKPF